MNRRKFLMVGGASIAVSGLTACEGGVQAIGANTELDEVVQPRTPAENNANRALLGRAGLPPENWDDGVALIYLAEDAASKPAVAARFELDPAGYTRALKLESASLESNSAEVQVVLSLRAPEVAEPLQRGDLRAALNAMEDGHAFDRSRRSELVPRSRTPLQRDVFALLAGELEAPAHVPPAVVALSERVTDAVATLDLFRVQNEVTAAELKTLIQHTMVRLGVGAAAA
jgi:hypothetical protein